MKSSSTSLLTSNNGFPIPKKAPRLQNPIESILERETSTHLRVSFALIIQRYGIFTLNKNDPIEYLFFNVPIRLKLVKRMIFQ